MMDAAQLDKGDAVLVMQCMSESLFSAQRVLSDDAFKQYEAILDQCYKIITDKEDDS